MKTRLDVFRVIGNELVHAGVIERAQRGGDESFSYEDSYLERGNVAPLSLSLPLTSKKYPAQEARPYFAGLLPEGPTREALVNSLGIPNDDYLAILEAVGLECIGDVVVRPAQENSNLPSVPWDTGTYESLDKASLRETLSTLSSLSKSNEQSRLSLAGTQGKVGLAHIPGADMSDGWLRPLSGAASTHILKTSNFSRIADFEIICMGAAAVCGIRSARVDVLSLGGTVACVERFDRAVDVQGSDLRVERLHQEDLAQAFGMTSGAKYAELEGGSYAAIARLLETRSTAPLEDVDQLARIAVLNYLVGNCDNHLKNLSITHSGSTIRLAPAYDLVCTTFFERFSREMGMRIGSTRMIDDVTPSDFALLAKDLGIGVKRMQSICSDLVDALPAALSGVGEKDSSINDSLPYSADNIIEDMHPRIGVARSFVQGVFR